MLRQSREYGRLILLPFDGVECYLLFVMQRMVMIWYLTEFSPWGVFLIGMGNSFMLSFGDRKF